MAFPTIATSAVGDQTSNSTSWTITYPSSIASGDLLLVIISSDGTATASDAATGFTLVRAAVDGDTAANKIVIFEKIADGTETGTFTYTNSGSEQGSWLALRITGWYGSGLPANGAGQQDGDGMSIVSYAPAATSPGTAILVGVSGGAMNPANWDVEDTLWIACGAWDSTPTATAKDANYTYPTGMPRTSGGAGGAGLAVSYRENAVASEDPGDYTISASENWVSAFIAVRPAAAAVTRVPYFQPYTQLLAH